MSHNWCAPGECYSYATSSSHVPAMIVRRLTGMEMEDYMRLRLTGPLGLPHHVFDVFSGYKRSNTVMNRDDVRSGLQMRQTGGDGILPPFSAFNNKNRLAEPGRLDEFPHFLHGFARSRDDDVVDYG